MMAITMCNWLRCIPRVSWYIHFKIEDTWLHLISYFQWTEHFLTVPDHVCHTLNGVILEFGVKITTCINYPFNLETIALLLENN